jgi:O-6-methylguanine DNA methyltransferase
LRAADGRSEDSHVDTSVVIGSLDTSLGRFGVVLTELGLARLGLPNESLEDCEHWARRRVPRATRVDDSTRLKRVGDELVAYLAGELRAFTITLDLRGTPFQVRVWRAVQGIEYGEVRTYASIAAQIDAPRAVRAVGAANGANPIPILIPCHRVLGSNGTLTGYGGGLEMKRRLLALEGRAV